MASIFVALLSIVFAVFSVTGFLEGTRYLMIEGLILTFTSLFLIAEIAFEGQNTGIFDRDWSVVEIIGAIVGVTTMASGLAFILGSFTGSVLFVIPGVVRGVAYSALSLFLIKELISE